MEIHSPKKGYLTNCIDLGYNKKDKKLVCYLPRGLNSTDFVFAKEVSYYEDLLFSSSNKEKIGYICATDWSSFLLYDTVGNIIIKDFALISYIGNYYFACYSESKETTRKEDHGRSGVYARYSISSDSLPKVYYKDIFLGEGEYTYENGLLYIRQGDKWKVYDKANLLFMIGDSDNIIYAESGKCLIDNTFDKISYTKNFILGYHSNGWGIWDLKGQHIIDDFFEEIQIEQNLIIAKNSVGWGAWRLDGGNILPAMQDSIKVFPEVIIYQIANKDGMVTHEGKCILTPKYNFDRICEQTIESHPDYDYYPFPEEGVYYSISGYDSSSDRTVSQTESLSAVRFSEHNEENSVFNGVDEVLYMPIAQNIIYLFSDGDDSLLVSTNDGIICRMSYTVKNRISDKLILVEQQNKLGVYSLESKSLIINCEYDRIKCDNNIFQCYRYIDDPKIDEDKNPIGKNNITIFQMDKNKNRCLEIYAYDIKHVFNIGKNLYVFVKSFTECELHYIKGEHIDYNDLFLFWNIGYFNRKEWKLYRPPYFIRENILCMPLSCYYENEIDVNMPFSNYDNEKMSIINSTLESISNVIPEQINQRVDLNIFPHDCEKHLRTTVVKYTLGKFNENTHEIKFCFLPKYDEICAREDGKYDVRIGKAWGIITESGVELTRIKYAEKVNSRYVKDAHTNCIGLLSEDLSTEMIPTIYHDLINGENAIPVAASIPARIETDLEWGIPTWKFNQQYAILKNSLTVITPHIYNEIIIHKGYILAVIGQHFSKESPHCDRLDIYNCNIEKVNSIENITFYCVQNLPLIRLIKYTNHNKLGREIFYHSLSEGWSTECYNDMYVIDSHMFIVGNADYPKYLYGIKNHKGEGTEIEFMFVTKPINGYCFAAKENSNTSDDENKSYSVYLFISKDKDTIERIPVVENISLEMLYELVDSDCFYLCSLKYCIDKELKELITQEFLVWANESISDFENAQSTKDRDGIYWLSSEITNMYTNRHYYDRDDYPHPSSAFEGDGWLYRDWLLG